MALSDKHDHFESLIRHNSGLSILQFVLDKPSPVNFGLLLEQLKISKRSLYITLKDLESEELITQTKIGRKSIISITDKGKKALNSFNASKDNKDLYQSVIESTVKQLEAEGIISKDWSPEERVKFIEKLSKSINTNL